MPSLACQKFLDAEKQVIISWCKVGTVHSMLENFAHEFFEQCAYERRFTVEHCCAIVFPRLCLSLLSDALWVPYLSSLLPFNLSLMCPSNGTTHEAPCQAVPSSQHLLPSCFVQTLFSAICCNSLSDLRSDLLFFP